ncbi:FecCD family ABC transporter permease [Roseibium aggregatum]|uniref:Iron ABC transporter permease n=1 Tax=Roseibium aggregatum TaxID=187304 RepID=A0A939EG23_9HYPH|nr:iron ABC transporter permease [Roseibium aggregatum]MBN9672259.1 iron ABC transporter permease [Roseibium aggregatum]
MRLERSLDGKRVVRFKSGLQIKLGNLYGAGLLLAAALVITAISVSVGTTQAGLADVLRSMFASALPEDASFAVWQVRLPRMAVGFMAGWLVAVSGVFLQSLARNPLADPGLFGLSQGSVTMILVLMVFMPQVPPAALPLAALAGGLMVAFALLWLVGSGNSSGLAILLMGIAMETILSAVTSILILYTPDEVSFALAAWMAGSLLLADWQGAATLAPWFLLSLPVCLLLGRALSAYDLGDETAMALGENVTRTRPLILLAAVLLSAAAVSAVGPLIFLGIMAPHIANAISPSTGRAKLLLSGLMGGLLVLAADAMTRGAAGGLTFPIGLSLTLIGVPLFVIALRLRTLRAYSE